MLKLFGSKDALRGKRVVVTGAASGIGLACAIELARRGAELALIDLDGPGLISAARAIEKAGGRAPIVHTADLSDPSAILTVVEALRSGGFGPIDILFSNAGVAVVKPLVETTDADWEWIFGINVWAPIRLIRAIAPEMVARKSGHIVLTASIAGLVGAPGMASYSTSKFAVIGMSEALRLELADAGIAVTAICPGYVRTNFHRATRYGNRGFERFLDAPPSWYGWTKERAAKVIVDGIARREPLIVFGFEKIGWWLKRVWPAAAFALTRRTARRYGVLPTPGQAELTPR